MYIWIDSVLLHHKLQSLQLSQSDQILSTATTILHQLHQLCKSYSRSRSDTGHYEKDRISKENTLLGQGASLQALVSPLAPGHGFPPNAGGGLVHVLDRLCSPPPQVKGQLLQPSQTDQLPSTETTILHQFHQHCKSYSRQGLTQAITKLTISKENTLLGQGASLQALVSSLSPGHGFPPNAGGGSVHVLDRFSTPPPQVTGQLLQALQPDQ